MTDSHPQNCTKCGAPLSSDQRYCLSCGHPSSPLRLAFLDVLKNDGHPRAAPEPDRGPRGRNGWLQQSAPVFALFSTLLLAVIIGLLIGHWVTQSKKASGPQIIKIEGLTLAAPAATTTTAPATETPAEIEAKTKSKKSEAQEEKEEKAEAEAEEKHPTKVKKPVKVTSKKITELNKTTGKKHEEEINKLGNQPIEVK